MMKSGTLKLREQGRHVRPRAGFMMPLTARRTVPHTNSMVHDPRSSPRPLDPFGRPRHARCF
jgi:hypothetical protein